MTIKLLIKKIYDTYSNNKINPTKKEFGKDARIESKRIISKGECKMVR